MLAPCSLSIFIKRLVQKDVLDPVSNNADV